MQKFAVVVCVFVGFAAVVMGSSARGCDLCGCYTPQLEASPGSLDNASGLPTAGAESTGRSWTTGLYGAIAEQYTYFGTLQENGDEVANPTDQFLEGSNTQLVIGYTVSNRLAFQFNAPYIYRRFSRPERFEIDNGSESGFGDISLLAKFLAWHTEFGGEPAPVGNADGKSVPVTIRDPDFAVSAVLLAGLKFPTGDTSRIQEEFSEEEVPGAPESGIHGHDLVLGTGSYDGIFGGQVSMRYRNWFLQGDVQYSLRGEGRDQYDFADDVTWDAGPGYYFIRRPDSIVGLQFVVSGEYKDVDQFQGEPAEDTGITSVFVGPRVVASVGRYSAELEVDLPVLIDNTALQAVPDYRIRGGIAVHF